MKKNKFTKDELRVIRSTERAIQICEKHLESIRVHAELAELEFQQFCENSGLIYSPRNII